MALTYYRTAERPELQFWLLDEDGDLIDFTTATFVFKIGLRGNTAVFTKSTGITGAAGAGDEDAGTPNVTVAFTAGELDSVTAHRLPYQWQLRATAGGLDRVYQGDITILDAVL
jgi:hypothetical protein